MKFPDRMALDRALLMLPMCPEREAIVGALLDDGGEYGFFPRHQDIKTVGDLRRDLAHDAPRLRDICPDTYIWLFTELDRPEPIPTPTPAIEDGARAHAANEFDDPAQLLPILDLIVQEGGKSHANFGDRLARLDLPYLQMIRFQDAVAKIVIDANHYDKVGALLREPDVRMVRARVQQAVMDKVEPLGVDFGEVLDRDPLVGKIIRGDPKPLTIAEIASLPTHHGVPIRQTSGDAYKQSWDNILPPEPAGPTMDQITDEIRQIIHSASGEKTAVVMGPKRPKTPKGKAGKPVPTSKSMGALADVLKDI